jgi:hypothetical protein
MSDWHVRKISTKLHSASDCVYVETYVATLLKNERINDMIKKICICYFFSSREYYC